MRAVLGRTVLGRTVLGGTVLVLGLLIILCASANAATVHHVRARQHGSVRPIVHPSQGVTAPGRFAVPGWTNEQTEHWLDAATSCAGCG
jgi:hypothetical protein